MERITFGETDGDCEGIVLEDIAVRHYVVALDGKDYELVRADNKGVWVRRRKNDLTVGPLLHIHFVEFDELHIY